MYWLLSYFFLALGLYSALWILFPFVVYVRHVRTSTAGHARQARYVVRVVSCRESRRDGDEPSGIWAYSLPDPEGRWVRWLSWRGDVRCWQSLYGWIFRSAGGVCFSSTSSGRPSICVRSVGVCNRSHFRVPCGIEFCNLSTPLLRCLSVSYSQGLRSNVWIFFGAGQKATRFLPKEDLWFAIKYNNYNNSFIVETRCFLPTKTGPLTIPTLDWDLYCRGRQTLNISRDNNWHQLRVGSDVAFFRAALVYRVKLYLLLWRFSRT